MEASGRPSTAQTVLLATSSALTAVLYTIYKRKASHVTRLREAKKLPLNPDLQTILAKAPGKCVPYAVIEGVVRSVKETLNSQFVDNCKGVIERLTLKEKKMVWNRTTHLCIYCGRSKGKSAAFWTSTGSCRADESRSLTWQRMMCHLVCAPYA
ncbi:mitochondrial ubiquitin ligase activator of NFKB 1-like isoform X2 [Myxocyprinus asiaticus]|nr:mitochondrial ubiquitin ligase activator of NFKB 1-like isoform X2 [Myxocyprinus asiaticus]